MTLTTFVSLAADHLWQSTAFAAAAALVALALKKNPAETPLMRRIQVQVNRPHVKVTYRKQYLQYPETR